MKRLSNILSSTEVISFTASSDIEIHALQYDSRKIEAGDCFFAVRGTQTDGHQYIDKAIESGAAVVVCEELPRNVSDKVSYVVVKDSNVAMADMAAAFYDNPSHQLQLVGVTGTNGKTTVATLLCDLFGALGYRAGLISTVVYRVGEREIESTHTTPDAIRLNAMLREMVDAGCDYCFMEVSSHALATYTVFNNSAKWDDATNKVRSNSAQWAKNDGDSAVNNWVHNHSANCETTNTTVGLNSNFWSNTCFVVMDNSASWGQGGTSFPITSQSGNTRYTLNASSNAMWFTTASGPAGATTRLDVRGVNFAAYPATDVSASWFNIINAANSKNITCSAVKLTTAASENWFYTSALPNLNEITFIAPSYGPYETYSALIDDGDTTFVAEVDSGCCMKVVRNWNDDRNKNCWCGLNQETYFYIG